MHLMQVRQTQLWSAPLLTGVAAIYASAAGVMMYVGVQLGFDGAMGVVWIMMNFGVPAVVQVAYHPRLRRFYHALYLGAAYAFLFDLATAIVFTIGGTPPFYWSVVFVNGVIMAVPCSLLTLIAWGASRISRGPLRVICEPHCLRCGYNLIGSTRFVCSECGWQYTLEELGVTADQLAVKPAGVQYLDQPHHEQPQIGPSA